MKFRHFWKTQTSTYFNIVVVAFVFILIVILVSDSIQSEKTRNSLEGYMGSLGDVIFMSTYDSLKKGNMKVFRNHLEEVGNYDDVREFSLIDTKGLVRYSSEPGLVGSDAPEIIGLQSQKKRVSPEGLLTYYFPVETTSYCSRCHPGWKEGSINSYYKLTLSRQAIDDLKSNTKSYHAVMAVSGLVFIVFLFVAAVNYERKKSEEQMLVSDSVQNFMDSVDDPFVSIDAEGICTFCNQAGLQLLGYSDEQELVGRNIHSVIQHTQQDGSSVPQEDFLLNRMMDAGRSVIVDETLLWRADGTYFIGECRLHPIVKQGSISGATITFLDITKKKAEELRTMKLSHLASMGELAAGVAHEINNPISGVINYAQIYKNRYDLDEKGEDLLNRIIKEGERIASIVFSLLNYAHQGSKKFERVNFVDVISETMNLFHARIDREGIILDISVDDHIPYIQGNFQNLEQVLINLISNARYALNKKYPESDHVDKMMHIILEHGADPDWPHIQLTVYDRGIGIPEGMLGKIMTPFVTTKPAGEGTGLGLHVCHNIINQHQGVIDIESEAGEYTKVVIKLPVLDTVDG